MAWLKRVILTPLVPRIYDYMLEYLDRLAKRTDNTVDDKVVETLRGFKGEIVAFLTTNLKTII